MVVTLSQEGGLEGRAVHVFAVSDDGLYIISNQVAEGRMKL
jgi:hypothetical protein